MNFHAARDLVFEVVAAASVLHTFLPPWDADALKPFPKLQSYYRLFIYVLGYVAINARSTVYKSISINNPDGVNGKPNGKS
jgi:hypothetical protein